MATHSAVGKRPDMRPALATLADDAEPDAVRLGLRGADEER